MSDKKGIELEDRFMISPSKDGFVFVDRYDKTRHWTVYFGQDCSGRGYLDIHEKSQTDNKRKASIRLYDDELGPVLLDVFNTAVEEYKEPLMQAAILVDDPPYKNWVVLLAKMKSLDEIPLERGKRGRLKVTERIMQQHLIEFGPGIVALPNIMQYDFDLAWVLNPPTGELLIKIRGEDRCLFRYTHLKELSRPIVRDLADRIKPLLRKEGEFSKLG